MAPTDPGARRPYAFRHPRSVGTLGPPVPGGSSVRSQAYLQASSASAVVLLTAVVLAIVWANSPWRRVLRTAVAHHDLRSDRRSARSREDLRHLVTDGLMALFFLLVGLEIKRELRPESCGAGESRRSRSSRRSEAWSFPRSSTCRVERGTPGIARRGASPMATDIAFALARADAGGRASAPRGPTAVPPGAGHRGRHRGDRRDRLLLLGRHRVADAGCRGPARARDRRTPADPGACHRGVPAPRVRFCGSRCSSRACTPRSPG